MALERGRGARRQRTLDIIGRRINPILTENIRNFEATGRLPYYLWKEEHDKPYWSFREGISCFSDKTLTTDDVNVLKRVYCVLDGRVGQSYTNRRGIKCGDCTGVGHRGGCDWCSYKMRLSEKISRRDARKELEELGYTGTLRHTNRVHSPYKD